MAMQCRLRRACALGNMAHRLSLYRPLCAEVHRPPPARIAAGVAFRSSSLLRHFSHARGMGPRSGLGNIVQCLVQRQRVCRQFAHHPTGRFPIPSDASRKIFQAPLPSDSSPISSSDTGTPGNSTIVASGTERTASRPPPSSARRSAIRPFKPPRLFDQLAQFRSEFEIIQPFPEGRPFVEFKHDLGAKARWRVASMGGP